MTTEGRIRDFLKESLLSASAGCDLSDEAELIDSGIVDSMGLFQVVAFLEHEFSIRVEDEDLMIDNFATIAEIASLVRSKQLPPSS